jgi:predicted PurR-regulated permease PerM
MFKVLRDWMQRYFSDEEAVVLAVLLFLAFTAVLTLGGMLAPVLAGMVLAFLMQGLVNALERCACRHGWRCGWCSRCSWAPWRCSCWCWCRCSGIS